MTSKPWPRWAAVVFLVYLFVAICLFVCLFVYLFLFHKTNANNVVTTVTTCFLVSAKIIRSLHNLCLRNNLIAYIFTTCTDSGLCRLQEFAASQADGPIAKPEGNERIFLTKCHRWNNTQLFHVYIVHADNVFLKLPEGSHSGVSLRFADLGSTFSVVATFRTHSQSCVDTIQFGQEGHLNGGGKVGVNEVELCPRERHNFHMKDQCCFKVWSWIIYWGNRGGIN